jgi:hypothetical protein
MRLDVIWGAKDAELDYDVVVVERAVGLAPEDLKDADVPVGVEVRAGTGSIGKGAAGTGVALCSRSPNTSSMTWGA